MYDRDTIADGARARRARAVGAGDATVSVGHSYHADPTHAAR